MKQLLQNLNSGETLLEDLPVPTCSSGGMLIQTSITLVSVGTERMLLEFGKANLIDKARQQPDKVKQVIEKARTDGIGPTLQAVRSKLDQPLPLGYSNVGVVAEVGKGVEGFEPGDRVVSNGHHAEVVCVPTNLCARIPDAVDDESASFTVLGAIALQGIRLIQPTLGENVVVTGLGLIGLMTVQLLRAHGCNVLGIDFDAERARMAREFGATTCVPSAGEDPVAMANRFSRGRGVDAVIITAATKSNEPVHQAATMCRKRGRIVLVGVVGLELSRADFFEKELTFQVSCSYGPGRYDPAYEEQGQDYPFGFVRWTEQRNFEAVLDMMATGRLDVKPLITHRFDINAAQEAYRVLGEESPLGIVLTYPNAGASVGAGRRVALPGGAIKPVAGAPGVSFIGAGNYAGQVLIPAFQAAGAKFDTLVSAGGVTSVHHGKKFGFQAAATDPAEVFRSASTDAVVIATRHDTHAGYVLQALQHRKHVFCEKPLTVAAEELAEIEDAYAAAIESGFNPVIMLGFNRRFAPQIVRMKALLDANPAPKSFVMTVNAGDIPPDHWTQDPVQGGGRIIGEGCHFIDLLRFLAASPISGIQATRMGAAPGVAIRDDKATITMAFEDGSFGTVHYLANGHRSFPKERLEVFCGGSVLQLDNFRRMTGYGWPGFKKMNLRTQDKGQKACAAAFVSALRDGGMAPIPFEEIVEVTRATFDAVRALHTDI